MEHLELSVELGYLADVTAELGVPQVLPDSADFLAGQRRLREAAAQWRDLATAVERASAVSLSCLGELDSSWQGESAEAFVEHVRSLGLAGRRLVDEMREMAASLEHTAEALRVQTRDLRELVADAVDELQDQLPESPQAARRTLACLAEPAHDLLSAVGESYRDLARACDAAADDGTGAGFLPLGMMTGLLGRRRDRRRTNSRPRGDAAELFGLPGNVSRTPDEITRKPKPPG